MSKNLKKTDVKKAERREQIAGGIQKAQKVYKTLKIIKAVIGIIAVIAFCAFLVWAIPKLGEGFAAAFKRLPQYNGIVR